MKKKKKIFVFAKLSRTSYDGDSIYREFETKEEAELFLNDLKTASVGDEFDEVDDLKPYMQSSEAFKAKFPYFHKMWLAEFKEGEEPYFGDDMLYDGAFPEQLFMNDESYIRNLDFQTIIEGESLFKDGWNDK